MHHLARTKKDKEVFSPVAELAVVTASPSHNSQAAGLNCGGCEEAAGGKLVRGAAQASCAEGRVCRLRQLLPLRLDQSRASRATRQASTFWQTD